MTRDQLSTTNNVAELKRNNIILATIDATRQVTTILNCKCGFSATGLFPRSVDKAIKCRYVIDDSDAPIHPEGRKTKRKTASGLNIVSDMEKKKRKEQNWEKILMRCVKRVIPGKCMSYLEKGHTINYYYFLKQFN
ncbi:MAG: hypothetical protein EZS28_031971 [Streblomastix strix]|uniref:DDE-1 domain-containing protein n=1 Tax=Streblomastix strix TaxID=222440 RepID=A0A5J4UR18_9EUKA|nr:MAG: hypothetical protein EZS28_031971 [Streblomastix strix]